MSPKLKLAFTSGCFVMIGVAMSAHAGMVVNTSMENSVDLDRSIRGDNPPVEWGLADAENIPDSASASLASHILDQERAPLLQPCCSVVRFVPDFNPPPADLDVRPYLDSESLSQHLSVSNTDGGMSNINAASITPTHGREPYVMLIAGLGLLGLAISLHRKSENKESEATSFSSHIHQRQARELYTPQHSADVPSGLKFT